MHLRSSMKLDLVPADVDDDFDIVPFISVAFLVMFVLLVASQFLEEAVGTRVDLPVGQAVPQTLLRDDADTVTLAVNGDIELRDAEGITSIESVEALEEKLKARPDCHRPLILRCDRHCTYEQYTRVKNAALNAGALTLFEETRTP